MAKLKNTTYNPQQGVWIVLRLLMGWTFFWAFIDKLFGLGYATEAGKSWLDGASPTYGFLKFGTGDGPWGEWFTSLAGQGWVDWLFMLGLLGIGAALLLGIAVRFAAASGVVLMLLLWAAVWPLEHNPLVDEHIVYAVVLIGLAHANAGQWFGLGTWWAKTPPVKALPFLK